MVGSTTQSLTHVSLSLSLSLIFEEEEEEEEEEAGALQPSSTAWRSTSTHAPPCYKGGLFSSLYMMCVVHVS